MTAALAGALLLAGGAAAHAAERGGVLLVLLDTLRADRLGSYGNERGLTPALDAFAKGAVRFEEAFSHAPWTLPSTASLYTSQHPAEHGAGGYKKRLDTLRDGATTIAEVLSSAGHTTGIVANVSFLGPLFRMTQGFGTVDVSAVAFGQGAPKKKARRAKETTDAALAWLRGHAEAKPFFLVAHYYDAHLPYDPPPPYRERFAAPEDRDGSEDLFGDEEQLLLLRDRSELDPEVIRRLEKLYDGEVAYLDREVGRLLSGLDELGLSGRTVVVVTADHGEEFLDHGSFEHSHTVYDELVRVPLLIRAPGVGKPGTTVSTTVRQIDLAPTLCELTGVAPSETFRGESLVSLLRGGKGADRSVLSEGNLRGGRVRGWRDDGMKLIRMEGEPVRHELYEVRKDPLEKNDLAASAPARVAGIEAGLDAFVGGFEAPAMARPAELPPAEVETLRSLGYLQ